MIDFNKEFKTDLLHIRPSKMDDADQLFSLTSDETLWIYFTSDLSIRKEFDYWLKTGIEDQTRLAMTVIDLSSQKMIGCTSIGNISTRDRRAEIGWTWLGKEFQGKGLNRKVKLILIQYLMEHCKMHRVELKTDVLNMPARKALEKIGFVEEGVLRSHTQMIRGRRRDTIYYSMLTEEWLKLKESGFIH